MKKIKGGPAGEGGAPVVGDSEEAMRGREKREQEGESRERMRKRGWVIVGLLLGLGFGEFIV